jgi:hypothetical protein
LVHRDSENDRIDILIVAVTTSSFINQFKNACYDWNIEKYNTENYLLKLFIFLFISTHGHDHQTL